MLAKDMYVTKALTHYANNLIYNNEEKQCRIMTVLGLLNLNPCLDYNEVSSSLRQLTWTVFEIADVTLQHSQL